MNNRKMLRWMGASGIVAGVLLIVGFPFYYAFIRNMMARLSDTGKTPTRNLSFLDKVDLYLEYELNKRLRRLGVGLYRLTQGRIARLAGAPADVLVLTTHGRKSGLERTVMLQGFRDGADLVVVAANSGKPSHPDWFYNLKATPMAKIEIGNRISQVRAEEMSADETAIFWPRIVRIAPSYARFQNATSRPIPLMRLVPVGPTGEQTMPTRIAQKGAEIEV
ncbi:MAG: nitroreductase/quinone reductase family protein [Ktedonobacterales bacterium]